MTATTMVIGAVGSALVRRRSARGSVGLFSTVAARAGFANHAAIGARVRVTVEDVTQTAEVGGGFGHYGAQNELTLNFGAGELAAGCEAEVEVRWPDADLTIERFRLPTGGAWLLVQGGEPTAR